MQKRLCFITFFKLSFPICASVNTLFTSGFLFPSYKPLILSSNWTSQITEVYPESCLHKKDEPGQVGPARSRSHPHRAALLSEWQKNNKKYKLYITTSSSCVFQLMPKKNIHEDLANFFWWFHSKSSKAKFQCEIFATQRLGGLGKFRRSSRRRCAGNLESVASNYQKLQPNGDKWHLVTNIHQTVAPGTYIQHVFLACNCFSSFFDGPLKTSSDVFVLGNAMGFFDNNILIWTLTFLHIFYPLSAVEFHAGADLCVSPMVRELRYSMVDGKTSTHSKQGGCGSRQKLQAL